MKVSSQNTNNSAPPAEPREAQQKADCEGKKQPITEATFIAVRRAVNKTSPFLSEQQRLTMVELSHGEEGEYYKQAFLALELLIEAMPITWQQDGKGDEATAHLHYFTPNSDYYITEKDFDGGVTQAFGLTILNGDLSFAEISYISITELVRHGAQLDLHWTPATLAAIKAGK